MSCNYCDKEKILIEKEQISNQSFGWGDITCKPSDIIYYKQGIFIDKRCDTMYLRLVNLEDCSCLEHGEKIEIKYCPFCGDKAN